MTKLLELKKPKMVADAAAAQKGLHIVLEVLIFIAVFIVSSIAELIVVTPIEVIFLFSNQDYMSSGAISGALARCIPSGIWSRAMSMASASAALSPAAPSCPQRWWQAGN